MSVDIENISAPAALVAGLLSFFSPCVLPMVPIYLGYLTGRVVTTAGEANRLRTFAHAVAFVLGFSLIFVALGATAGLLGSWLSPVTPYLIQVGGLLLVILGLHMTGLISLPFLNVDRRLELDSRRPKNLWSSFLVGIVFAAGWTPCVGPVLTSILILAADSRTVTIGSWLLAVYSLGLGVPFLVVALLLDAALPLLHKGRQVLRLASLVGGVLMIAMGLLLLVGLFRPLIFWLNARLGA